MATQGCRGRGLSSNLTEAEHFGINTSYHFPTMGPLSHVLDHTQVMPHHEQRINVGRDLSGDEAIVQLQSVSRGIMHGRSR
jgi:hypothetical protein